MKKTFSIKGMHCNSCAQLIERSLNDKVNSVKVSYAKESAEIDFDENKISEKEIQNLIGKEGYECNYKISAENESSNKMQKKDWILLISMICLVALAILYQVTGFNFSIPHIQLPELYQNASLALLFIIGILTGFHCVSMCGGFVLSYTAKNALNGYKGFMQHLIYGTSKVISYTIMGGIFGLIGSIFSFSIKLRGTIAILAGLFMIFYALSMFGFKLFRRFQFKPKFLMTLSTKAPKGEYMGPLFTGLLNGLFIACGPLQAMYLYAAGTGSFFSGAISLAIFGIGTLPIMLMFGSLATILSHKTTGRILKISAVIVLILGLIMLNRGLSLTGSNFSFDTIKTGIIGAGGLSANTQTQNSVTITNGVQEVNMKVDSSGYSPNSFVLKKGVPVKWNVNVEELTGCNQELVMNEYGIDVNLKQGLNIIEFTPTKTGTITFTCGMAMLHGNFIVTEDGNATTAQIQAATPKTSGTCGMASGGSCGGSCGSSCTCGGKTN
jgi:sulfite exporter TauE/SafE/copper chaperone CopZ